MKRNERKKWNELRKVIIDRDKQCMICKIFKNNKIHKLHVHHLIPEIINTHRFDEQNLMTLCMFHHKGKYSAHQHPFWFINISRNFFKNHS